VHRSRYAHNWILMPVSPARAAAFDILLRVERQGAYASELLHSSQYRKLSPVDHGLATELVMGVLRWRSLLDSEIAPVCSRKLEKLDAAVLLALRVAAYQLNFLDRVPKRAAVHESVELVKRARKRSAVPFVNAALRKLSNQASPIRYASAIADAKSVAELSVRSAHPQWLVERWVSEFGHRSTQQICLYDQHAPETAIRLGEPLLEDELKKGGIQLAPGRLLASARRVQSGDVTQTRAFLDRRVIVQDEASQLVALLVGRGSSILDCCAAPGGKTRIMAHRNPDAAIVAVELHSRRARLLRKLVSAKNVQVLTANVRELPVSVAFDRVLADVPCSGTGTLARNPEIKWRLEPEDLADLHVRQLAILQAAMQHVAHGGRLIYSTCSLEPEENSQVVEKAVTADSSFHLVDCRQELEQLLSESQLVWKDLDSLTNGAYLRTIPGVHPCDGFFVAILEKS
jgi:16S rRNA (cytosine967-C5)-methyltransferase